MDRIGKTTLAREILKVKNVKNIYKATCFIKSKSDDFIISCDMLKQLEQSQEKLRHCKEAKDRLKVFVNKNKVLLVFDDVTKQSDIEKIVSISDIFGASNGSTLIVTTRDL